MMMANTHIHVCLYTYMCAHTFLHVVESLPLYSSSIQDLLFSEIQENQEGVECQDDVVAWELD